MLDRSDYFLIFVFVLIYLLSLYDAINTNEYGVVIKLTIFASIIYYAWYNNKNNRTRE